jgi:hypothetical protein
MSFGPTVLLTRDVAFTHHLLFVSLRLLLCERRGWAVTFWFNFTASLFSFCPLAPGLSRASPSPERQANLNSGRLYWEADNDKMPRAGPEPYVSSTHCLWGCRWRPGRPMCCTLPCRTNKQARVPRVFDQGLSLSELCSSVSSPLWQNLRIQSLTWIRL